MWQANQIVSVVFNTAKGSVWPKEADVSEILNNRRTRAFKESLSKKDIQEHKFGFKKDTVTFDFLEAVCHRDGFSLNWNTN